MARVCLFATLAAVLPANVHLFLRATYRNLLQALVITSLGFFLFSFQVHEKSILLVTAPVLLLLPTTSTAIDQRWLILFLQTATFSMTPLLRKDGLLLAYFGTSTMFLLAVVCLSAIRADSAAPMAGRLHGPGEKAQLVVCAASIVIQTALVLALNFVQPPQRFPFLFELLISAFGGGHFLLYFGYFYAQQFLGTAAAQEGRLSNSSKSR